MFEARAPDVNDFSNDGDRNFFRKYGTDVESDRHIDSLQALAGNSFAFELLGNRANLPFAADHADIPCIGLNRPAQYVLILLVAASHDDHIRVVGWNDLFKSLFEALRVNHFSFRKALGIRINGSVIDDRRTETRDRGDFGNLSRNVTCAEDNHFRSRQDGLDEYFDFTAANQTTLGHRFVGQIKAH